MRTNKEKLVQMSVQGTVANPGHRRSYGVDAEGIPFLLPGTGGIVYNVKVGDNAFGWAADHLEPCVSTILDEKNKYEYPNSGYHFYSCIGNTAKIVSNDAKGDTGIVTGHHGGAEHIIIDFSDETLEKMRLDDKILIKGYGQGLKLLDYPDIHLFNLDPELLEKWGILEKDGKLEIPVKLIIPGMLMGSGVGSTSMGTGDYDIMTADKKMVKKYKLDTLCFGDFVAIKDHCNIYGRTYYKNAITIGIIIHADCHWAGHGPGVTTLISTKKSKLIVPKIDENANIGKILKIGRYR